MKENKICPMLAVTSSLPAEYMCKCENCAWYFNGRCAVQYLGAMPELVKKVGQL